MQWPDFFNYHLGTGLTMTKREDIQQRRLDGLESEFRSLLPRMLKECASGRWCVWRIVTWEPDFTGNRAAKLRKCVESRFRDASRGSETMGAATHAAMERLRMISWKFCRS